MVPLLHVYWAITRSFFVFYEFKCQVGNHEVTLVNVYVDFVVFTRIAGTS